MAVETGDLGKTAHQNRIARELKQTKARRESYIADFIAPVKEKLAAEGLKFEIKDALVHPVRGQALLGHGIHAAGAYLHLHPTLPNKLKKQNNTLEEIYDLFAIRVVIDCEPAREKSECWLAYSLIRAGLGSLEDIAHIIHPRVEVALGLDALVHPVRGQALLGHGIHAAGLAWVVTSKARNKIRSVLKENANRTAELGRELLERRLRNRKLEVDESELSRIIARMGYKDQAGG